MKPHPEMTVQRVFDLMMSSEMLPQRLGVPMTDVERGEEQARVAHLISSQPDNLRIICTACDGSVPLLSAAICTCGGFVCPTCAASEDGDDCNHTPHPLGDLPDDEADS